MNERLKPKSSVSEEISSKSVYDKEIFSSNLNSSFRTQNEIFRNNTTAVEVIVKEIRHKGSRKSFSNVQKPENERTTIETLREDNKRLRNELHKANFNLENTQKGCKLILCEMKKQLEEANQRELKTQTKNLVLQLENEKLRNLLESKSNLVTKLKKEVVGMRRMVKVVLKGIRLVTSFPVTICHSDVEYEEFEKDLINNAFAMITANSLNIDSYPEN